MICDDAVKKPLTIIYNNCIKTGIYPHAQKKCKLSHFIKKKISNLLTITDLFHFFLFLVRFLRKSYLIPLLITNHVFNLLIHVSINYFLLFMTFIHLLIVTPQRSERDCS